MPSLRLSLLHPAGAGRWTEEREGITSLKQILHLGTGTVIVDEHLKTQVSEAPEKGLGIFVGAVADAHTCGNQASPG